MAPAEEDVAGEGAQPLEMQFQAQIAEGWCLVTTGLEQVGQGSRLILSALTTRAAQATVDHGAEVVTRAAEIVVDRSVKTIVVAGASIARFVLERRRQPP
jgi:hypothetical protein